MPTMADIDPEIQFVLMKGEPGTRKSTAALSYPLPQYWFSFDMKMESLSLPMRHWGIDPNLIDYDDYSGNSAWNDALKRLDAFQLNRKSRAGDVKTIIADSVTSIGDGINRQTLNIKGGTTTSSGQEAGKRIAGIPVNTVEDFNAEMSAFQTLISKLKDIHKFHKVNVILIAHILQTETKSLDGQTHMSRTLVTGGKKAAAKIPAYCTEIYHFNIESGAKVGSGGRYTLLTTHTGDDFARTALPLDKLIYLDDNHLYDTHIKPAIAKLKVPYKPVVKL